DKDAGGLVAALAPAASLLVATEAPSPRTRTAADLAAVAGRAAPGVPVIAEPDPAAALARALAGGGPAVVAGSIFLVGPLRARLAGGAP
ncbi:MAG: bifunctional folylpolyglutamate synthase/dihydrofolate synthase, partial [Vicinamibacterales bacterium]